MPVFFDISRYLRDKYFDVVWGYRTPQGPPKINFQLARAGALAFFDDSTFLRHEYFDIVWGITPLGTPQKLTPQN